MPERPEPASFWPIASAMPGAAWAVDGDGRFTYVNDSFEALAGIAREALIGLRPPYDAVQLPSFIVSATLSRNTASTVTDIAARHPQTAALHEFRVQTIPLGSGGETSGHAFILHDVTAHNGAQQAASESASGAAERSGEMTGLLDRHQFFRKLETFLPSDARSADPYAVVLVGIDATPGGAHAVEEGRENPSVAEAAKRLGSIAEENGGHMARVGPDELALVVKMTPDADPQSVCESVVASVSKPFFHDRKLLAISAHAGTAVFPQHARDGRKLLDQAKLALRAAKSNRIGRCQLYDELLVAEANERFALETDLRRSLDRNDFSTHFQAKVDLSSGSVVGAEALMRWNHPLMGSIPPGLFIPLAEETGLIVPLGERILLEACRFAASWNGSRSRTIRVAVNLSARQVMPDDFLTLLSTCLASTGCRPEWIELEMAETVLMSENQRVEELMQGLHAQGVGITIDDFGIGYSAVNNLSRLHVRTLNIDRSLVRAAARNERSAAVVRAIVAMARELGIKCVAVGVERPEEAEFALRAGCQEAQGFLWQRPMPEDDFLRWLESPSAEGVGSASS